MPYSADLAADDFPPHSARRIKSIAAANSLEFLEAVFDCYAAGKLFAITRSDIAPELYAANIERITHSTETRGWGRLPHVPEFSDAPAQIVFTSGTEGRPKAIALSRRNLADVVRRLNDVMQVTEEIREYVCIPVTYSFGLGRIRAVSAAGGSFFLPERFDPVEIARMAQAGEINAISAVPSLWRLVLKNPDVIGPAGAAIRWIEIGSQYMTADEKAQMRKLFPNARIVQHYGMTEASRATFLVISDTWDPEVLASVGRAEGVRISPEDAIRLRGDHVALGRLEERGGLVPLTDAEGWLVSGDRGEIRDGNLHYLGRMDDQMNLGGIKVGSEALEARVVALVPEAGGHFALTPVADEMRGEVVLLAMEPPAAALQPALEAATRHALSEKGVQAGGMLRSLTLETLPRTATGKIQRASLRGAACQSSVPAAGGQGANMAPLTPPQERVAALWRRVLGPVEISAGSNFHDVGGDSLSGLQVGLAMEEAGLSRAAVNATLSGRSLAEVAVLVETGTPRENGAETADLPEQTRISWSLTMTRAVVVVSVLASHWGPGLFNALAGVVPVWLTDLLWPFYRMGTPGFAMVFGIGLGLYMLPDMATRPEAAFHRTRNAFRLVLAGVIVQALFLLIRFHMEGRPLNGLWISNAFYGVLTYYAIMLGTARLWLPPLARMRHPLRDLPVLALGLWLLWPLADHVITDVQQRSFLELPRLMLAAGYSVFKLSAMTVAGIAAGIWIRQASDPRHAARGLTIAGALGAALCVAVLVQAHGPGFLTSNSHLYTSMPGLIFYGCVCLLLMGLFLRVVPRWSRSTGPARPAFRLGMVLGGLALPIYVFHQVVLPARDSLVLFGWPGLPALTVPMAVFLLAMLYLGRRVWRMYFT